MTRWRPDTCDCMVDYDSSITYIATIKTCKEPDHIAVTGTSAHLTILLAHNRSYNQRVRTKPLDPSKELEMRAFGVTDPRAYSEFKGSSWDDVIEHLDEEEQISNDKRTEKQRIRDL